MTVPPFELLALAIPVLLIGEQLNARVRRFGRLNIPAPIIGGLFIAVVILLAQRLGAGVTIQDKTTSGCWLWPILPRWSVAATADATSVYQPLLILFFTCIGLNASATLARQGGLPLLGFLGLATAFAVVQNLVGVFVARLIGVDPLMGIMCGGVTLMGGFGTAASWSKAFEQHGLPDATAIGIAAAAFGVIAAGLLAGPLAGRLIERKRLAIARSEVITSDLAFPDAAPARRGFIGDIAAMFRAPGKTLMHLVLLLICLKLGAFLSAAVGGVRIGEQKLTFPTYMGSLIIAAIVRNVHDLAGARFIDTRHVDVIASFSLAWLLAVVMIGLQLGQLVHLAVPILVLLGVQVALMVALAYWVVFPLMGRDYEAAMMSGGMFGFGIGATHNALASMRQVSVRYGPAPRAFLVVSIVGAFLIDFTNAFSIMGFLNGF